jgi:type IV pilus assembly protein PilY1
VDGPISTADVDFGGGDWHTILVGGLGKGGNTYYALDITDPDAADESAAASKVLWEFSDPDLAYSYSKPIIAKTYAFGWTVIVATGYNNPSGIGKIFFIDPKTGAKLATLSTNFGTPASPSGLAQISGFTKDFHNQFIEQIYGGDLYGNVWRFDVHDPAIASWTVTKLAKLTDKGGGAVQPITTAPQIEIDFANGEDRYVFVGTGQLLDISDFTNPSPQQQQTMYAIRDGSVSAPDLAAATRVRSDFAEVLDKDGLPSASATGWLFDLPVGPNERIVTPIEADLNVVAFAGTQAQNDPCVTSLPADLYALEFATGRSVLLDSGGNIVPSIYSASGAVGVTLVSVQTAAPNDVPTLKLVYTPEQVDQPLAALNLQSPVIGGGHRFWFRYLPGQ